MFVKKTTEEIAALSEEERKKYFADKAVHDKEEMIKSFDVKIEEQTKDFLKKDEVEKIKLDFKTLIEGMPVEELKKYQETIGDLNAKVKTLEEANAEIKGIAEAQGTILAKMNDDSGLNIPDVRTKVSKKGQMEELIKRALCSSEFEQFEKRGFKGATDKMFLDQTEKKIELKEMTTKATVDMATHTGDVMISEISDIIRDDNPTRMTHVRELMSVSGTTQAQIVAGEVYDFTDALTLGALMLSENGEAPESVFKSKENTWGLKRIANSMRISKRYFKTNGLQWVINKVMSKLPDATLYVEDYQLLFGDGVGNNVDGLSKEARSFDLEPDNYIATNFASVATYNAGDQALITFDVDHNMQNGSNLVIANATEATYNATHKSVEIVNAKQVVIDLTYVAEADTSAWTGSSQSPFYQSIEGAQEVDVLSVSDAELEAGEYANTGYVMNPKQGTQIGLLKNSQLDYLNLTRDSNGRVTGINGKPIAYTTAMPYGKWMNGDFSRNGLELKEFTPLNIQFVEDVESVKKNEIVVVIEEEIIFPVYNPKWFIFGKFSTAKTQLETP